MLRRNLKKLKNRVSGTLRRRHTQQFVRRGDGVAPNVPHFVVYEPTLLCNLHCSFCYVADILNPADWRSKELIHRRAGPDLRTRSHQVHQHYRR